MPTDYLFILVTTCMAATCAYGLMHYRLAPAPREYSALGTAAVCCLWVVMCLLIVLGIINSPLEFWNGLRAVGPVGLAKGLDIYFPLDSGPKISGLGGPVMALFYTPAALARTPNGVMSVGTALSLLVFLFPFGILCFWTMREFPARFQSSLFAACCAVVAAFTLLPLVKSALLIHSDAPALGLSAAGLAIIFFRRDVPRNSVLFLGCFLCVLAFFSKITVLPVLAVIPVYCLSIHGFRTFVRSVIFLLAGFFAVLLLISLFIDLATLAPTMGSRAMESHWMRSLEDPSAGFTRTTGEWIKVFVAALTQLWMFATPILLVLGIALSLKLAAQNELKVRGLCTELRHGQWSPFFLASILCVPTSVLGRIRAGGADNTLSPSLYYLLVGTLVAVFACLPLLRVWDGKWLGRRMQEIFLFLIACSLVSANIRRAYGWVSQLRRIPVSIHQTAYEFNKLHPEQVYFADSPLAGLLVDKKIYHSRALLGEYQLYGITLSDEDFLRYLPSRLRWTALLGRDEPYLRRIFQGDIRESALKPPDGWLLFEAARERDFGKAD